MKTRTTPRIPGLFAYASLPIWLACASPGPPAPDKPATLDRHFSSIKFAGFSPRGDYVISLEHGHTLIAHSYPARREIFRIADRGMSSAVLSGDGKILVTGGLSGIKAYDAATGKLRIAWPQLSGKVYHASRRGERVAFRNYERGWEILHLNKGQLVRIPNARKGEKIHAVYALEAGGWLKVFSARVEAYRPDGSLLRKFKTFEQDAVSASPNASDLSPDGSLLAIGEISGDIRLYRTRDGSLAESVRLPRIYGIQIRFAADPRYLLVFGGGEQFYYDRERKKSFAITGIGDPERMDLAPGGRSLLLGYEDGRLKAVSLVAHRKGPLSADPEKSPAEAMLKRIEKTLRPGCEDNKCDFCVAGDCQNGEGTYRYTPQREYTGQFQNGKPHGTGTLRAKDSVHKGQFRDGDPHGPGELKAGDGSRITGTWKDGLLDGPVRVVDSAGNEMKMEMRAGQVWTGFGYRQWRGKYYHGHLKEGKPHGQGLLIDVEHPLKTFLRSGPMYFREGRVIAEDEIDFTKARGEILAAGLLHVPGEITREYYGPDQPGNNVLAAEVKVSRETREMKRIKGTRFGMRFRLSGLPPNYTVGLRYLIRMRPNADRPAGGRTYFHRRLHLVTDEDGRTTSFLGYELNRPGELEAGTWTMEIFLKDRKLIETSFVTKDP